MNDCPPVRKKRGAGLGAKLKIFNAFGKRSRFVTACGAGALLRRDFNAGTGFFFRLKIRISIAEHFVSERQLKRDARKLDIDFSILFRASVQLFCNVRAHPQLC